MKKKKYSANVFVSYKETEIISKSKDITIFEAVNEDQKPIPTEPSATSKSPHCCKCHICDDIKPSWPEYLVHMKEHFPDPAPFSCDICDKKYNSFVVFVDHHRLHVKPTTQRRRCRPKVALGERIKVEENTAEDGTLQSKRNGRKYNSPGFQCHLCPFVSKQRGDLMTHLHRHLGVCEHVCRVCKRTFVSRSALWAHRRTLQHRAVAESLGVVEKIREYKCDQCEFNTVWQSSLQKHVHAFHSAQTTTHTTSPRQRAAPLVRYLALPPPTEAMDTHLLRTLLTTDTHLPKTQPTLLPTLSGRREHLPMDLTIVDLTPI